MSFCPFGTLEPLIIKKKGQNKKGQNRDKKGQKGTKIMWGDNMNVFNETDLIEEILNAIETNYGTPIERIVKCDEFDNYFNFTIVFTDYTLLDAKVHVRSMFNMPSINIEGTYY